MCHARALSRVSASRVVPVNGATATNEHAGGRVRKRRACVRVVPKCRNAAGFVVGVVPSAPKVACDSHTV